MFHDRVYPVLTPLAVDPAHPFPYISNLSMNLAVMVKETESGEQRFARVKVPPILPRFIELPDRSGFVPLEQLISAHIDELFPGMQVSKCHPFRLTRNTDYELAEFETNDPPFSGPEVRNRSAASRSGDAAGGGARHRPRPYWNC